MIFLKLYIQLLYISLYESWKYEINTTKTFASDCAKVGFKKLLSQTIFSWVFICSVVSIFTKS